MKKLIVILLILSIFAASCGNYEHQTDETNFVDTYIIGKPVKLYHAGGNTRATELDNGQIVTLPKDLIGLIELGVMYKFGVQTDLSEYENYVRTLELYE